MGTVFNIKWNLSFTTTKFYDDLPFVTIISCTTIAATKRWL